MQRIIPFLWLHGENKEALEQEIDAVYGASLRAFCVESRPHPAFCGPGWWHDMDIILHKAEKLGMQVWILDDRIYPTGYANGGIVKRPALRQWHIAARNVDAVGDEFGKLLLQKFDDDELIGAYAVPHGDELCFRDLVDLSDCVHGDVLYFSLPRKLYRFVTVWKTHEGSERENYIDMMNADSVRVLIDEVYEPHYQRYKKYFGSTIQGFFSDEPRFGNFYNERSQIRGNSYECNIGKPGLSYPFSDELQTKLHEKGWSDRDFLKLWFDCGEGTGRFRIDFMKMITDAYAKNFTEQIGEWCRARGIHYAGHIIEDMNANTHTSCSAGHYFKSQKGQSIAGIDVVLHQIKPYSLQYDHLAPISGGKASPSFFCYTLPNLAKSCALLDENKQGRALCEIFGAYGFGESIAEMKWLADLMLANGINHFIPHAFSPKENDDDCPPHFYCAGKNPSYRPFSALMRYMEEMTGYISDGKAAVHCCVFYHAETEWSVGKNETVDRIVKCLADAQIPSAILPYDRAECLQELDCIVLPWAQDLPKEWLDAAARFGKEKVVFAPQFPDDTFVAKVRSLVRREIVLSPSVPGVFAYAYRKKEGGVYILFNAGAERYSGTVTFNDETVSSRIVKNVQTGEVQTAGNHFPVEMESGECVVILPAINVAGGQKHILRERKMQIERRPKALSFDGKTVFIPSENDGCGDVNRIAGAESFSGSVFYEAKADFETAGYYRLAFDKVGGSLRIESDGKDFGWRIGRPYVFDLGWQERGLHKYYIEVCSTPVMAVKDALSRWASIEPLGILNNPLLQQYEI